jgi:serine/threonine-protein kinase
VGCYTILPADALSCPSCGFRISGAPLSESTLLTHLAEEFTQEVREGKRPDEEEYAARHPELSDRIRELFPILVALENVAGKQGRADRTGPTDDVDDARSSPGTHISGRFVAGTILSSRYRIVTLVGKGGMGEVYRAEDLKLEQPVALKFLPKQLSKDGGALSRFHREVRLARNVAHPNICRVFDINEVDGQHFLSMEYIDGEDLASLLKKIGRPRHDYGVEIALQLCRGLAAAHENDVLHCDLKPANVMIDRRGKARITDFGLARMDHELRIITAGTPSYMAPEQISRGEVSAKSDIYSLGLVFYEIFTGKRAFQAETLAERVLPRHRSGPPRPSKLEPDIDPTVDKVIMSCLREEPDKRPSLQRVQIALSGGSLLDKVLAAGETPSPEMVTEAPGDGEMRLAKGLAFLGLFLVSLAIKVMLSGVGMLHREAPLLKSPAVLADRAELIIESLGHPNRPKDLAYGFEQDDQYLDSVAEHDPSPERWKWLGKGRPPAIYFWYRQSPEYLVAGSQGKVTSIDPALDLPGMVSLSLDTGGRMTGFYAVPGAASEKDQAPNWEVLFEKAGLQIGQFKRVPVIGSLTVASDARAAWEGCIPEQPDLPIHIEAASYHGLPVFFRIAGWGSASHRSYKPTEARASFKQGAESRAFFTFGLTIFVVAVAGGVILTRKNIWNGLGDRRGATRLGLYIVAVHMLAFIFQAHHVAAIEELGLLYTAMAWAVFYAVILWVLYMALEPDVRRRWTVRIISWNRLLTGRLFDRLVGRDILIGASIGTAITTLASCAYLAVKSLGIRPDKPPSVILDSLLGTRALIGQFFALQEECVTDQLFALFTLLLLSKFLRKDWRASVAAWLLFTFAGAVLFGVQHPLNWIVVSIVIAGYLVVLAKFGFLATISFQFCNFMLLTFPLTANFSNWYAGTTVFVLLTTVGFAFFGFFTALSGRSAVRRSLLQDSGV